MPQQFKKGDISVNLGEEIIGTEGKPTGVFKSNLGDFSREDLTQQGFTPEPTPVIGVDPNAARISEGSDGITDNNILLQNQTDKLKNGDDGTPLDLNQELSNFRELGASINTTSDEEEELIARAGEGIGSEFDVAIADALDKARGGQARNLVGSGRNQGGLFRARFAGQAALGPTEGDTFEGAGGKLELAASAYARNVDNLRAKKIQAVQSAENAARAAIKSGKQVDFENAQAILNTARQFSKDAEDKIQQEFSNLLAVGQEERQQATADFNIISKIGEGEQVTLGDTTYTGIKKEDIDPFWTSASLVSLMKELPMGEKKVINDPNTGADIEITGLQEKGAGNQVFKSVNQNTGDETFTTVNKEGVIVAQSESKGTGAKFKAGTGIGTGTETDRLLTLSEQKAYNMPVGTTLQQAIDSGAAPIEDVNDKDNITADVQSIMGADQKLDTSKYLTLRSGVAANSPILLKWFDETFPPSKWISKDDPALSGIQKTTGNFN